MKFKLVLFENVIDSIKMRPSAEAMEIISMHNPKIHSKDDYDLPDITDHDTILLTLSKWIKAGSYSNGYGMLYFKVIADGTNTIDMFGKVHAITAPQTVSANWMFIRNETNRDYPNTFKLGNTHYAIDMKTGAIKEI